MSVLRLDRAALTTEPATLADIIGAIQRVELTNLKTTGFTGAGHGREHALDQFALRRSEEGHDVLQVLTVKRAHRLAKAVLSSTAGDQTTPIVRA